MCVLLVHVELETHDERIYFILNDVREMMFALNKSIVRLNVSTLTKLRAMDGRLTEVELMIGAMEEKSQTAFIKEVQGIHKEVRRCVVRSSKRVVMRLEVEQSVCVKYNIIFVL